MRKKSGEQSEYDAVSVEKEKLQKEVKYTEKNPQIYFESH